MGLVQQIALVTEVESISATELSQASAALQKQLSRDFAPIWGLNTTIDAFSHLEDVPLTYWPILVRDDIGMNAAGVHEDHSGQPFALVQYSNQWTLTASHEMLEMSADPFGRRLLQSVSIEDPNRRVEYLVEVCDPCEAAEYAYHVNGVLVSDFYTPNFFDPVKGSCVRYDLTGAIAGPRQVLPGGYISWHDPQDNGWYQQLWLGGSKPQVKKLAALKAREGSLREQVDRQTPVPTFVEGLPAGAEALMSAQASRESVDGAAQARAKMLRTQIDELTASSS
jgi:hypothetical protein